MILRSVPDILDDSAPTEILHRQVDIGAAAIDASTHLNNHLVGYEQDDPRRVFVAARLSQVLEQLP